MKAADVISQLAALGVELWQEGEALRYRAPLGVLTEREKAALRAHKASILRALEPLPASSTVPADSQPVAPTTAATEALPARIEANRQAMPIIADAVDRLRAVFGDGVKVVYARENGRELGTEPPPGVVAHQPHVPVKRRSHQQPEGRS